MGVDLTTVHDALGSGHEGPVWLLDLDVGGRVYRVADLPVEVGGQLYEGGLTPLSVSESGDLLDSLGLELDVGEDWAALVVSGVVLERARAVVRRWWPGQDLDRAEVVISGWVDEPEWGSRDEPLTITVTRDERGSGLLLEPGGVADETTWPPGHLQSVGDHQLSPSAEGQIYPMIIGCPGLVRATVGLVTTPASPGLLVSVDWGDDTPAEPTASSLVLIAGHRVAATEVSVTIWGADRVLTESRPVHHVKDALGRTVAVVDFVSSTLPAFGETPEIWFGWPDGGGGLPGPDGQAIRGAGDVISWVLRHRTSLPVDWGRMAAVLPELNRYQVDAWINAQVGAWEWIESELLRLLPVAVLESERGRYLRLIRWDATRGDAVAHLDADLHQVDRLSRLVQIRQQVANELELVYRQQQGARWTGRRWIAGERGRLAGGREDHRVGYHPRCAASLARYGSLPARQPYEAAWVYDEDTAVRILQHLAARYALPLRSVRYAGGWELDPIEPWDVVTISDSEIALDEAVALVSQRTVDEAGVVLDLILLP